MRLGEAAHGRDNNLNLLRFAAASLVLLSHCWPLAQGTDANEPAHQLFGVEMGRMAVWVFFALSGFLVAGSWERRPTLAAFFGARARRIFPGLLVMLALLVFVLGPLVATIPLSEYFTQRKTWTFLVVNATLYEIRWGIPGVMGGTALNGSLWTLPLEVRCYLVLGVAGFLGLHRRGPAVFVAAACAAVALWVWREPVSGPLALSFLAGVCAWRWRQRIELNGLAAAAFLLAAAIMLHHRVPMAQHAMALALAYGSFYLGYVPGGAVRAFNRVGDYSYGMYIYAFPVQVTTHYLWPQLGVWGMFAVAMPVTLVLAMLSWRFVESPALRWGAGKGLTLPRRLAASTPSP